MIANFDRFGKYETPSLTLCNPGSTTSDIGMTTYVVSPIPFPSNVEIIFNFLEPSELNFTSSYPLNKVHEDDTLQSVYENVSKIKVNRLVYVDGVGYFSIDSVKEHIAENVYYKDVSAKSIEVEFRNRNIPYIKNGQYAIMDTVVQIDEEDVEVPGILNMIVGSMPIWNIVHVDDVFVDRVRTITDVDISSNCLDFMRNTVQDLFECIISFDIKNREISVFDKNTYDYSANVFLSYDDVLKSVNGELSYDRAITALNVHGDGDIGIAAVNPIGTNTIYNYSEYLSWMPEQLADKVTQWQSECARTAVNYAFIASRYYKLMAVVSAQTIYLESATRCVELYKTLKDNIITSGSTESVSSVNAVLVNYDGEQITVSTDVYSTLNEIDGIINRYETEMTFIRGNIRAAEISAEYERQDMNRLNDACSMDRFFTEDELGLLSLYTFEGSYTDSDIVITESMSIDQRFEQMSTLYKNAIKKLNEVASPQPEFSVDSDSFIFSSEYQGVTSLLDVGKFVYIDIGRGDYERLLLLSASVNFDDMNVSFKFGNKYTKSNPKAVFDSMFDGISKTANTVAYLRDTVYDGRISKIDGIKTDLEQLRTIVLNSVGQTPTGPEGYRAVDASSTSVTCDSSQNGEAANPNNPYTPTSNSIIIGDTELTEEDLIKLLQMIKR